MALGGVIHTSRPNNVWLSFPDQLPKLRIDSGAVDLTKHGKVFDKVSCKFIASKHFLLVNTTQLRKIRYVTKITISLLFLSLCRCQNWKRNMGTWNKSMWPLVNPAKKASVGIWKLMWEETKWATEISEETNIKRLQQACSEKTLYKIERLCFMSGWLAWQQNNVHYCLLCQFLS